MTTYAKYRIFLFSLELTDGKFLRVIISKMAAAPLRRKRFSTRCGVPPMSSMAEKVRTAGVNSQNSSLLLEFFTQRGRKPYPRKLNLTFGYFSLRRLGFRRVQFQATDCEASLKIGLACASCSVRQ